MTPQTLQPLDAPLLAHEADPALELRAVSKVYPGTPPVVALNETNLRIDRGEMVAVVGPSGSGKSTMLNMMGSLDRPTSGQVLIEGTDTSTLNDDEITAIRGRRIGFVFQRFFLLPGVTTVDNVANGLLYAGVRRPERRAAAAEALKAVGLGHRLDHLPNELSGGETQRVAVARALVHNPAVVLADEPTGNLDSASSAAVMSLLRELNDSGRTLIVITHDHAIAQSMPRQVRMLDGNIERDS
jgi:putative ABC transport system ATP-binding protein